MVRKWQLDMWRALAEILGGPEEAERQDVVSAKSADRPGRRLRRAVPPRPKAREPAPAGKPKP
jgi:hypothetical protein